MITCYLRYEIDPLKTREFEAYGKMWIPLVNRLGGTHHGYFLPNESSNYIAIAMFSFASLEAYADYRTKAASDPECQKAVAYAQETKCFLRYERSFFRPVFQ
jgi:hypothetical protein